MKSRSSAIAYRSPHAWSTWRNVNGCSPGVRTVCRRNVEESLVDPEQVLDAPELSVARFYMHHSLGSQFFGPFNRRLLRSCYGTSPFRMG
jgi:hypothetical protein